MKIQVVRIDGTESKSPSAKLALLNWYFDEVTKGATESPVVYIADNPLSFLQQVIAAIERCCGRSPILNQDQSFDAQYLSLLQFLYRNGQLRTLNIS